MHLIHPHYTYVDDGRFVCKDGHGVIVGVHELHKHIIAEERDAKVSISCCFRKLVELNFVLAM